MPTECRASRGGDSPRDRAGWLEPPTGVNRTRQRGSHHVNGALKR
jgi:hypothetical protein